MSSAGSTVSGDGNGHGESDPAVSPSNEPVFTPDLPKKTSVGMKKGHQPEDAQDHETTRQRSAPLDRTRQNVQERAQRNNKPLPSSSRPNARAETKSNPVVAANSSSRPQGPPASQSGPFYRGDTTSRNIGEQRGTEERIAARGYPTHRSSEDKESRSASSATRPTYGGQASSSLPAAATQAFMQPPTLSPNAQTQNVNVTPTNADQQAANTGTAQRPPQRPGEFDQAATSSRDRGDVYASAINPARNNDAGGRVPYRPNPSTSAEPRSGTSPQNQHVSNTAPVVSRAPPLPLPVSQTNRSDEQSANPPYSLASSVRSRDQPGSDSTITITSTTLGNPPAPLPRHTSTQNVTAAPTYMNPLAVDPEPSQRPSQRPAGFDEAATSSGSSGGRVKASDLSSATAPKNEPRFQVPYTTNPAAGTRVPQSATSFQSHNVSSSAPVVSGAPPLPLLASQPNPRTRDQLDLDSDLRTTLTLMSKLSAPEPRHPSTQNVNAISIPMNARAMDIETSQRPPQRPAGFNQAITSGGSSGDRELASNPPFTTTRKNEPVAQVPETSNPAAGPRIPQSTTPVRNHTVSNSASAASGAPLSIPASQTNRSEEKKSTTSFTLPLFSGADDQGHVSSGSAVTTTPTPIGKPSARPPRGTRSYQSPGASVSTQHPGDMDERLTSDSLRGRDNSYTRGYNPTAPLNPASQPSQSDRKTPTVPFSSPPNTEAQDHTGSSSIEAAASTPVRHSSAPQPRNNRASPNPSASATTHQQSENVEERTAQKRPLGDPPGVGFSYNQARGYNPDASSGSPYLPTMGQAGSSSTAPQPSSYLTSVSPTAPTVAQQLSLSSASSGSSVPKHAKRKEADFHTTPLNIGSVWTGREGTTTGGESESKPTTSSPLPSTTRKTEVLTGDARGFGLFESREQDKELVTLGSIMAKYSSLDLTTELRTQSKPSAHGGLAEVYEGSWRNKKALFEVAVKVIKTYGNWTVDSHVDASKLHIATMMRNWATLKHRNICDFLGYSTGFGDYPALVFMWCQGKTSLDYLRNVLLVEKRIRLARDVAEGLQYLHAHDPKVVHGDLTLTNVLVDESGVARLCDIGLIRLPEWRQLSETSSTEGVRYKAPELFITSDNPNPVVTPEGDIYSLGCVMLKFIEQMPLFARFSNQDVKNQILNKNHPALRGESRGTALGHMTDFFWNQLEACWGAPSRRPTIEQVVKALEILADKLRSDGHGPNLPPLGQPTTTTRSPEAGTPSNTDVGCWDSFVSLICCRSGPPKAPKPDAGF